MNAHGMRKNCLILVFVIISSIFCSCQDDFLGLFGSGIEEGKPATVTLSVNVPEMSNVTRAIVDEDGANYCQTIWIGIYLKSTGERTSEFYYDATAESESPDVAYKIKNFTFPTVSGESYIVAVANSDSYEGLTSEMADASAAENLTTLLRDADTWEKFQDITVYDDPTNVQQFTYDLLMSGYYTTGSDQAASTTIPTVGIPEGTVTLPGAIYLRHMISYNKFNIKPASSDITVKLKTWRVHNVPATSNVLEGDQNSGSTLSKVAEDYGTSIESQTFDYVSATEKSLDFYLFENKHTGLTSCTTYEDRDKEYKVGDGSDSGTNTGIYKSLVSETEKNNGNIINNYASYLEFTADVDYYVLKSKVVDDNQPGQAEVATSEEVAANPSNYIHRHGEATYIVHLGYCEGKDDGNPTATTAQDFNCRRNTKYTYNVTIAGLNKLVVEARRESTDPEIQPGQEGIVEDIYDTSHELDAHYNVFNIALTDYERATMHWRITAPFAGTSYTYYSENYKGSSNAEAYAALQKNPLYNWIEFTEAPYDDTTLSYGLAEYPGETYDENGIGSVTRPSGLWSLADFCDKSNITSYDSNDSSGSRYYDAETGKYFDKTTKRYYTVFVDEYVYHTDLQNSQSDRGGKETLWYTYANQANRKVELISGTMEQSTDRESVYMHTLYSFSQHSIQTFYGNVSTASSEVGFGAEHINESYGLNLRWLYSGTYANAYNGRYNLWQYFVKYGYDWSSYVDMNTITNIPGYTFSGTNATLVSREDAEYPVRQQKAQAEKISTYYNDPSPNSEYAYTVNIACLNRNRDLNGDGVISVDEVKWYLPTLEQYIYLTIGEKALETPIIDLNKYPRDSYRSQNNQSDGASVSCRWNFHYATSDLQAFWAEEGVSNSYNPFASKGDANCFQIRCVRNLGYNPTVAPTTSRDYDAPIAKSGNTFTNRYFDANCLRPGVATFLPPHPLNGTAAMIPSGFEVASRNMFNAESDYVEGNGYSLDANGNILDKYGIMYFKKSSGQVNPADGTTGSNVMDRAQHYDQAFKVNSLCSMYYQNADKSDLGTWRMPNVRELALISLIGDFRIINPSSYRVPSCTHDYFTSYGNNGTEFYRYYGTSGWGFLTRGACHIGYTNVIRCVRDVNRTRRR